MQPLTRLATQTMDMMPPMSPSFTPGKNRVQATPGKKNNRNIDLTPFNPFARGTRSCDSFINDNPGTPLSQGSNSCFSARSQNGETKTDLVNFKFLSAVASIAHPEKSNKGEDSYFISGCGYAVGVADGVGGWSEHGIDAGEYARELMSYAKDFVEATQCKNPQRALSDAYESVRVQGSTTACIATMHGKYLRVCNLGDSRVLLFRYVESEENENIPSLDNMANAGRTVGYWGLAFQTTDQQHYFNCPRQLGTNSSDYPYDADEYVVDCLPGDIAIVATDGVTDNLSIKEICEILNEFSLENFNDIDRLAKKIAIEASRASQDCTRDTPFARNAKIHGMAYQGGKLDDITVVTGFVYEDEKVTMNTCESSSWVTPAKGRRSAFSTPDTRYSTPSSQSTYSEDN